MNHTIIDRWPQDNGALLVGGKTLLSIADQAGCDAFYVYDTTRIRTRIDELRSALPSRIGIHYAIKANPFPPVLAHIAPLVDGFDVASAIEIERAITAGMSPQNISFAGPGKRTNELLLAIENGILINIESPRQIDEITRLGQTVGIRPRVALRINPAFELRSAGMRMGGGARPFGVDEELAPQLLRDIGSRGLDFFGLHIFAGSQCLRGEEIAAAQRNSLDLVFRLAEHAPNAIRSINLGGGFGIPYFTGEQPLDLSPITAALAEIRIATDKAFGTIDLHLELGRYLVGEAGLYVTRIVDKKNSRGETFLITSGGMNHHLAASGNLGQVIRKNYPISIVRRNHDKSTEVVNVHGPLCTPLDVLATKAELPYAEIGDWAVIFQSGAYGASASPQFFLSHEPLTEILV